MTDTNQGGRDLQQTFSHHSEDGGNAKPEDLHFRALQIDLSKFLHHLDQSDWSEAQKLEYLAVIEGFIVDWIDLGLQIDPVDTDLHKDDSRQDSSQDLDLTPSPSSTGGERHETEHNHS